MFRNLNLSLKIAAALGIMLLLMIVSNIYLISRLIDLKDRIDGTNNTLIPALSMIAEINNNTTNFRLNQLQLGSAKNNNEIGYLFTVNDSLANSISKIVEMCLRDDLLGKYESRLNHFALNWKKYIEYNSIYEGLILHNPESASYLLNGEPQYYYQLVSKELSSLAHYSKEESIFISKLAADSYQETLDIVINMILLTFITSFLIGLLIITDIKRPIESVIKMANDLAVGRNPEIQDSNRGDEIGKLIRAFNKIITSNLLLIKQTKKISEGDFSEDFVLRCDRDEMGYAINKMNFALKSSHDEVISKQNLLEYNYQQYKLLASNIPNTDIFLVNNNGILVVAEGEELLKCELRLRYSEGVHIDDAFKSPISEIISSIFLDSFDDKSSDRVFQIDNRFFKLHSIPIKSEDNDNTVVIMVQNISQSKINEKMLEETIRTLKERTDELVGVMNAVPAVIWFSHNKTGSMITGSKYAYDFLGMKYSENQSLTATDGSAATHYKVFAGGKELSGEDLPLQKVSKYGIGLTDFEEEIRFNDGRSKKLIGNISPLFDSEGNARGAVSAFIDITDLKIAQEKLKRSEILYRTLASNIPNGAVFLSDRNGELLVAEGKEMQNRALVGKHLVGRNISELIQNESENFLKNNLQSALEGRDENFEFEYEGISYSIRSVTLWNEKHEIDGAMALVMNITEEKAIRSELAANETKLRELNATKDKFFSLIAHDLRNPLGFFASSVEVLCNRIDELDKDSIKAIAHDINASSKSLSNLLDNLLQWAKSQTGRIHVDPVLIELHELLAGGAFIYRKKINDKEIEIVNNIPPTLKIMGDYNMIYTIFRNLISNAIKFTQVGGKIVFNSTENDDSITISVADNGIGMKQEDIDKLFKIEHHHTTIGTSNEKGTGLGLILCKEFVEKHDGRIEVLSKPGKGTVFTVTLPK